MSCLLPDCSKVVKRTRTGRQGLYCTEEHGREYRRRRTSLLNAIAAIERRTGGAARYERGVQRRQLSADLKYLHTALISYPRPSPATAE